MASWLNQLRAFCISNRLRSARGYNLIRSTDGVALELPPGSVGKGSKGTDIKEYVVNAHAAIDPQNPTAADYVVCTPAGGGSVEKILKPTLLWFSIGSRNVHGQTFRYSAYDSNVQSRLAQNAIASITQYITPFYGPGDIILACSVPHYDAYYGTTSSLLRDLNIDGRVFAGPSS